MVILTGNPRIPLLPVLCCVISLLPLSFLLKKSTGLSWAWRTPFETGLLLSNYTLSLLISQSLISLSAKEYM